MATMSRTPIETWDVSPARLDFRVVRGDPFRVDMQLVFGNVLNGGVIGPDDRTVDLRTAELRMQVRRLPGDDVVLEPEYVQLDAQFGIWGFYAPREDTVHLHGSYMYDIQVHPGWYTILSGSFHVQRDFTKGGKP